MSDNANNAGGISFFGLLFLTFLILKLCNVINWSWWWVTAPLWGGFAIVAIIGFIGLIYVSIGYVAHKITKKK